MKKIMLLGLLGVFLGHDYAVADSDKHNKHHNKDHKKDHNNTDNKNPQDKDSSHHKKKDHKKY